MYLFIESVNITIDGGVIAILLVFWLMHRYK